MFHTFVVISDNLHGLLIRTQNLALPSNNQWWCDVPSVIFSLKIVDFSSNIQFPAWMQQICRYRIAQNFDGGKV